MVLPHLWSQLTEGARVQALITEQQGQIFLYVGRYSHKENLDPESTFYSAKKRIKELRRSELQQRVH